MIYQFSVSDARSAISCPRIFYFDEQRFRRSGVTTKRVTRIWTGGGRATSGCGTLFHHTVERFNALASQSPEIRTMLERAARLDSGQARVQLLVDEFKRFVIAHCLNREHLNRKSPPQQQAFVRAVDQYMGELADVLGYAVCHGRSPAEVVTEFFGDSRKRVDVTFHVGARNEPIRVRGALDYIYFDYRQACNRILDFKLTPPDAVAKDLFQASLYALMHHQQHQTSASVAVMYLHPERTMAEATWAEVAANRHKVFDLLASMAQWVDYDETTDAGLKPPGEPALCSICPWNRDNECQRRLGPVQLGEYVDCWSAAATRSTPPEPAMDCHVPPEPAPGAEFDDVEEEPIAESDPQASHSVPPASSPAACSAATTSGREHGVREGGSPEGLYLGTTVATGQPVRLPLAALSTHVSVVGAAGSGKSWLAKVIVEEAICHRIPVLAIDPQGDLVQFLYPAQLNESNSADVRRAQAEFRKRCDVRIWTPGTSHGRRLALSPLRLPDLADLQSIESPQRRQEEWESMLSVIAANLVQLAAAGGDAEVQKTFVFDILRRLNSGIRAEREIGLSDVVNALGNPALVGMDDPEQMISKREREKLQRRLNARLLGPTANLFTGGVPLDLDQFVCPIDNQRTPLNVIYLNALADDQQKQYFVAALAAEIYRWMITSVSSGRLRLLVFLDEARDFLPAGAAKPPAKEPLLRLFAQGRKFGVGCLVCTQSPRSVDYQVFTNASTKFVGRLEAAQDVQRVGEWFSTGSVPPWLAHRKGAAKGSLVGRWPEMPPDLDGAEFRSRPLYSLHEGAWSPDRVEHEWERTQLHGGDRQDGK